MLGRKPRQGGRLRLARARHPGRDPRPAKSVDESKYRGMLDARRPRRALGLRRLRRHRAARPRGGREDRPALSDRVRRPARSSRPTAARSPPRSLEDCPTRARFLLPVGGAGLAGGFAVLREGRAARLPHHRLPARALPRARALARAGRGRARRCRPSRRRPAASRAASVEPASRPCATASTAWRC